eukprot:4183336-Pyramimonas_sp.AAC.1
MRGSRWHSVKDCPVNEATSRKGFLVGLGDSSMEDSAEMDIALPPPPAATSDYASINRHPEAAAERQHLDSLKQVEARIEEETKIWATGEDTKDCDNKDPWSEQQSDPL